MVAVRLNLFAGALVLAALALALALVPAWTVEGRLKAASCSYESTRDHWSSYVTLTVQPDRGGRPLTFKTSAVIGSCDVLGHGGRLALPWLHFSRTPPSASPCAPSWTRTPTPRRPGPASGPSSCGRAASR